jgi:hypothetical protein
MSSIPVQEVFNRLHAAGHGITRTPQGGLRVTHASKLTDQLRHLIANSKVELAKWLDTSAANDALEPLDWKRKHQHYIKHHFQCGSCISGSQGVEGGSRCNIGSTLWAAYINATGDATIKPAIAKFQESSGSSESNDFVGKKSMVGAESQMSRIPLRIAQRNLETPSKGTRE